MGTVLNLGGFSGDFRYKILKPMFVNFLMAANVFDMPAALFSRYLELFDIESAAPMQTWDGGARRIYENIAAGFPDKIYLNRGVRKVYRYRTGVVVEDEAGVREKFDDVVLACNANQALMALDLPTLLERFILSSIRYESEPHNHAIVHSESSVLPQSPAEALTARSNHIEQYGARPDNYEITYIMHNQQPWVGASDRPCLVTYNPISPIDEEKVIARRWFQHVVHDVRHMVLLVPLFRFIQGRRRTWHCGAPLVNSQETLPGYRTGGGQATRRRLPVRGFGSPGLVQSLRESVVRAGIPQGLEPKTRPNNAVDCDHRPPVGQRIPT